MLMASLKILQLALRGFHYIYDELLMAFWCNKQAQPSI